jgi:hypothetical protein
MKNPIFALLLAALVANPIISTAQNDQSEPNLSVQVKAPWVSDKGYWITEGNINSPLSHVIYFYNNHHQLIYQEKLVDVKIDFRKKKTLMKMKKALELSIVSWQTAKTVAYDQHLVAKSLGLKSNGR